MAGVPPPPRQLEVRRFAAARAGELRSLHSAVSARLESSGRRTQQHRSARRRTTGHLPSKRRRRSGDSEGGTREQDDSSNPSRKQSRRVRRRRELAGNAAEGFSVAGDGARRLRTHLWHAKRFSMERHWGFVLPVGAHGRIAIPALRMHITPIHDREGLKECSQAAENGTVVHDSSYFVPIQLDGPEDSLLSILRMVLHPSPADKALDLKRMQDQVMRGVRYESAMMQVSGAVVKFCSLEGKIARLDVMGCKAIQSLKRILHPIINSSTINMVPCTSNVSTLTDAPLDSSNSSDLSKASLTDHAGILQPGAVVSMIVHDPRVVSDQGTSSKFVALNKENEVLEEDVVTNVDEAPSEVGNILSSMWMHPGRHDLFLSDCNELWDSSHNINPPVAEEVLCVEKHHERMKFFCLDSGNDPGPTTQEKDSLDRSCPVVLLKHAKEGTLALGKAYASFMAKQAAVLDKTFECRPVAKRPPRVPIPPLWHCILACYGKDGGVLRGLEADDLMHTTVVLPKVSPTNSVSGGSEPLQGKFPASLQPHVPRTIQTLRQYVKEFDMKYLSSSSGMEMAIDQPNLASNSTVKTTCSFDKLCLARVLIRSFKEGCFEEGAVVCAPFLSDLSAWKIRSEEDEEECVEKWELQLPQSHVSSYFSWLDHSTSSPQLPKDDALLRWPIGFVTTGFVHGSSGQDAVAVAFCEAKLLAVLRQQQWAHENLQNREICVLVRNARSAAYRRALATIVLEQQEADLEFL
ncbi:hypothetical protein PR202_gb13705 [Eleusine coracana subsp. coracana]|uniref:Uncharacterized protein n=1 Tax=Eleusine coracana subsp. coracana TaxID=191504 RepID=A0AAV5EUE0_ELECO|nr:hypothetical protein PR202_gb13705 [Eleusine coracana subsp. coracana]